MLYIDTGGGFTKSKFTVVQAYKSHAVRFCAAVEIRRLNW